MSPTPSLKSSGLLRYNNLGQIDNFKLVQILKIVTSPDRSSITEHNGTIINAHGEIQLFQKFHKIAPPPPPIKFLN